MNIAVKPKAPYQQLLDAPPGVITKVIDGEIYMQAQPRIRSLPVGFSPSWSCLLALAVAFQADGELFLKPSSARTIRTGVRSYGRTGHCGLESGTCSSHTRRLF